MIRSAIMGKESDYNIAALEGPCILILTEFDLDCLKNGLSLLGSYGLKFFSQNILNKPFLSNVGK